ncbi:SDR family NAD(P)-dependent oxidoreductase [Bordetella sp. LUAb4]|uniref:SDR family NAD(P)-dependent oxidoreductase n=1 Tax=Bordetella sp. LUAb4 TaxID=2843195 RepID=UPI001E32978C|nr:SDR family NAD(P)-dependent oxidoreductase [Bordetella sp. LUAb4]
MTTPTLRGKAALITGSNDGLGLAIAERLAAQGCRIVLHGLVPAQSMAAQVAELRDRWSVDIFYVQCDLLPGNDADPVGGLIEQAVAHVGRIDILVNNAVIRHFDPVERLPLRQWNNSLAVNLTAAFRATQLVIPPMRAQRWGRIFNMTSVYGARATTNRVDYVTTKTAIVGFTRAVALECIDDGITCNALCPGSVLTPNIDARIADVMQAQDLERDAAVKVFLKGKQPNGQLVDAADVAEMVAYLCGPAARQITGVVMPIDGGWLAS